MNIGLSDFMPGSTNYSLMVSRSPALELGEQLRYLVQYPYGCTEQTVSAAFPQIYYSDLSDLMTQNKQQQKTECKHQYPGSYPENKNAAVIQWSCYAVGW
ncbi:MAG: hypothetical protein IPJ29_15250 [Chitinophagaceae bacterium]|nr:hypothetical protein [Chitinophagaceae bacterium]